MSADSFMPLQSFVVTINFFSGEVRYASEIYAIDAVNWYRAEQAAIALSGESTYDRPGIPALSRTAVAQATEA